MCSSNWSGWAPYHIRRPQQDDILNSGQKHRWSLMTVLYIGVRSLCYKRLGGWHVALNSKYSRCAISEYYTLCMSSRLAMCSILIPSHFPQSASTCCVCPLPTLACFCWLTAYRNSSDSLNDRTSEYSTLMPVIVAQLTHMQGWVRFLTNLFI